MNLQRPAEIHKSITVRILFSFLFSVMALSQGYGSVRNVWSVMHSRKLWHLWSEWEMTDAATFLTRNELTTPFMRCVVCGCDALQQLTKPNLENHFYWQLPFKVRNFHRQTYWSYDTKQIKSQWIKSSHVMLDSFPHETAARQWKLEKLLLSHLVLKVSVCRI